MKLPEPVAYHFTDDPVRWALPGHGFCFKADLPSDAINVMPLFAETQMREALASHEAVMRMALRVLHETGHHSPSEAIKALEDALGT